MYDAGGDTERAGRGADDAGRRVRLAAFAFLETQVRRHGEVLPRDVLAPGFDLDGRRVPLLGPQGIFKPAVLPMVLLSITTVPVIEGRPQPYDDGFGADGLLRYRYRGEDPAHRDNVGLREAMRRRAPLVYLHGVVLGRYAAFDRGVIGVRPDAVVEVRRDVLAEVDGPMLRHGLQALHGRRLLVLPTRPEHRPDPAYLEVRYERFRRAS